MPFIRRDIVGGSVATTLVGTVTAIDTTWTIADATGWPVGTNGPFYAMFGRGLPEEETVLCLGRSGTTITLAGTSSRGVDGSTAQAHSAPVSFEHVGAAVDLDEANLTVTQTVGQVQALGDVLTGKSANRFQRTPVGSNDALLIADSAQPGGVRWGSVPTGGINSATQIVDGTITVAKIAWGPYGRLSLIGQSPAVASGGSGAVMGFQTVDYDPTVLFTSSTTFTTPIGYAGLWRFGVGIHWPYPGGSDETRRYVALRFNGTTIVAEDARTSLATLDTPMAVPAVEYRMAEGDTMEVVVIQNSPGTLTLSTGGSASFFSASFVRPT